MKLDIIRKTLEVYDDASFEYCQNDRLSIIKKLLEFEDDCDTYPMCHDFYSYDNTGQTAILKALILDFPIVKVDEVAE